MTLTEFLNARLDEDEAALRAVIDAGAQRGGLLSNDWGHEISLPPPCDPARVLREVEAKRKILADIVSLIDGMDARIESEWGSGWTHSTGESDALVKIMAAVYSDHPDYQAAWGGDA